MNWSGTFKQLSENIFSYGLTAQFSFLIEKQESSNFKEEKSKKSTFFQNKIHKR